MDILKSPLVSIVLATYNSGKYLLEGLESVKTQTYQNLELIITDDGSSDQTIDICTAWLLENGDRFKATHLLKTDVNTGIPSNCNRGLHAAKGEWIKLLAGDDTLVVTCIQDNVNFTLKNKQAKLVQSNCNYYKDYIIQNNFIGKSKLQGDKFFSHEISAKEQNKLLLFKNRMLACSIFMNRDMLLEVGGFDERLRLIEDLPLWTKLTGLGIKVFFFPDVTYNYRKSSNSVILQNKPYMRAEYAKQLLIFYKLYKKGKINGLNAFRYEKGLKLIIFLNEKGLNKPGFINFLLFKLTLKFIN